MPKRKKIDKEILEQIKNTLGSLHGHDHDVEDVAYLLARAYLKASDLILKGDAIFDKDGKSVGSLTEYNYENEQLEIKVKIDDPIHFINVNLNIDELGKGKK